MGPGIRDPGCPIRGPIGPIPCCLIRRTIIRRIHIIKKSQQAPFAVNYFKDGSHRHPSHKNQQLKRPKQREITVKLYVIFQIKATVEFLFCDFVHLIYNFA
jgi:hypothetical protein